MPGIVVRRRNEEKGAGLYLHSAELLGVDRELGRVFLVCFCLQRRFNHSGCFIEAGGKGALSGYPGMVLVIAERVSAREHHYETCRT